MSLKGTADGETLVGHINRCDVLTLSAYAIAVKHGYEGTEEEWLESLHGGYVDDTLTEQFVAAEAKATGEAIKAHAESKGNPHGSTAEDVGARPNTWMPTASDVGAAPDGYGLGGTGADVTDLDNATNNGWYWWTSGAVNAPFAYGSMIVLKRGTRITQLAFDPFMVGHGGIVVRHNNGTSWLEWQWLNPPMNVGSEYLLAERYQNKSVYTKLIALGALPNNSSKNVDIGVNEERIVRAEIMIGNGTNLMHLPYFLADGTLAAKHLFNATNVQITTTRDYSGYTGHVHIWYTKN